MMGFDNLTLKDLDSLKDLLVLHSPTKKNQIPFSPGTAGGLDSWANIHYKLH